MFPLNALVDYYNLPFLDRGPRATYTDHLSAVDSLVSILQTASAQLTPRPTEMNIRLYGGWHSAINNSFTEAREILGAISRKHYPTRRPMRTLLEPADSLIALPTESLPHTHRLWRGLTPFRLADQIATVCPLDPTSCPLHDLDHWRKGKCPRSSNCSRTTGAVANSERQKMVDTAIVADALTLARESRGWLVAVSNDDDIIPAVIAGRLLTNHLFLLRVGRRIESPYDPLLDRAGLTVLNVEVTR